MTSRDELIALAERLETFDGEVEEMDALLNEATDTLHKLADENAKLRGLLAEASEAIELDDGIKLDRVLTKIHAALKGDK